MSKKRKCLGLLAAAILIMLLLAGCSNKQTTDNGAGDKSTENKSLAAKAPEDKNPIKIGFVGVLTGASSELGTGAQKAIDLAVEEWNSKGGINGHPIKLISRDDKYDPTTGVNSVNELINKEQVLAIIGPTGSSVIKATLPITKAAGVPQVINLAGDTQFSEPVIPNVFRVSVSNKIQTKMIAEIVNQKFNKIGIITDSTSYGMPGGDEIIANLEKLGSGNKIVGREKYNPKDLDMTAQLLRLKKAGAEVLVLWGLGGDAANIRKNMKNTGFEVPVFGASAVVMKSYRDLAGPLVEGTYSTYVKTFMLDLTPEAKQFTEHWKKKYPDEKTFWGNGDKPSYYMASPGHTYDAAYILFTAIKNSKSLNRQDIISSLNNIQNMKGVNGVYTFSETNHDAIIPDDITFVKVLPDTVKAITPDEIEKK